jgi:two-component system OmpR family response regulator
MTAPFMFRSCPVRDTLSMRVLVVEDEIRMADVIRRSLVREGLAVDVATTGERATWMATAVDYDAIVLDVMLPGASGFETCRGCASGGCGRRC